LQLAVRLKARQYPAGVVVVKQLAAEFQVQLAAEFGRIASLNIFDCQNLLFS